VEPGDNFPSEIEFVPMLHRPEFIQAFEASDAIKTAKYVLGFNEPNVSPAWGLASFGVEYGRA
jgi:hypothetical protein